jgi:hypothetical protein
MATFRGYLTKKKKLTEPQVEEIIKILKDWWHDPRFPERTREQLMGFVKSSLALEKTERLFAKEFAMYNPVLNNYQLLEDVNKEKLATDIQKMKEGHCPFCDGKLKIFWNGIQYCYRDDKAFSIRREVGNG